MLCRGVVADAAVPAAAGSAIRVAIVASLETALSKPKQDTSMVKVSLHDLL